MIIIYFEYWNDDILGHTRQGLKCKICKMNVHFDCQDKASKCQTKARLLRRQKSTSEIETRTLEAPVEDESKTLVFVFCNLYRFWKIFISFITLYHRNIFTHSVTHTFIWVTIFGFELNINNPKITFSWKAHSLTFLSANVVSWVEFAFTSYYSVSLK